ncbi:MAG: hypothetical protein ACRCX2_26655 [Paraclostridium sp.]
MNHDNDTNMYSNLIQAILDCTATNTREQAIVDSATCTMLTSNERDIYTMLITIIATNEAHGSMFVPKPISPQFKEAIEAIKQQVHHELFVINNTGFQEEKELRKLFYIYIHSYQYSLIDDRDHYKKHSSKEYKDFQDAFCAIGWMDTLDVCNFYPYRGEFGVNDTYSEFSPSGQAWKLAYTIAYKLGRFDKDYDTVVQENKRIHRREIVADGKKLFQWIVDSKDLPSQYQIMKDIAAYGLTRDNIYDILVQMLHISTTYGLIEDGEVERCVPARDIVKDIHLYDCAAYNAFNGLETEEENELHELFSDQIYMYLKKHYKKNTHIPLNKEITDLVSVFKQIESTDNIASFDFSKVVNRFGVEREYSTKSLSGKAWKLIYTIAHKSGIFDKDYDTVVQENKQRDIK